MHTRRLSRESHPTKHLERESSADRLLIRMRSSTSSSSRSSHPRCRWHTTWRLEGVLNSLMDRRLPQSATLSPEILQSAIGGFIALREMELNEIHRLVLGPNPPHPCSSTNCLHARQRVQESDAHQKVIDRITGSSRSGTRVLQVLSLSSIYGGDSHGFCESCVKGWEVGHVEVRRRAWDMLPNLFGLKG
jgi:hypothetical protein